MDLSDATRNTPPDPLRAIHAVARVTLALVFLWHGMVPKLLVRHADELRLLRDSGLGADAAARTLTIVGIAEVVFAVALVVAWRVRALFLLAAIVMVVITPGIVLNSPQFIPAAFTPVTLNLSVAALAVVGWLAAPKATVRIARPARAEQAGAADRA